MSDTTFFIMGTLATVTISLSICFGVLTFKDLIKNGKYEELENTIEKNKERQEVINKLILYENIDNYRKSLEILNNSYDIINSDILIKQHDVKDIEKLINNNYENTILDIMKLQSDIKEKELNNKEEINKIDRISILNDKNKEIDILQNKIVMNNLNN